MCEADQKTIYRKKLKIKMKKNIIILERRLFSAFGHERTQIETINEYFNNNSSYVITSKNFIDFPKKMVKMIKNYKMYSKNTEDGKKYLINKIHNLLKFISEKEY